MTKPRTIRFALLLLLAATFALSGQQVFAAKHAAKMLYAFGDVTAAGKDGKRKLSKGDFVFSGETVVTGRGRAQIRFTDGGFVSMQPNTDYRLDEYHYEGKKADTKERSFFSLLKGSIRFVSGAVGKNNNRNFRIQTSVATIGIRGSAAEATLVASPVAAAGGGMHATGLFASALIPAAQLGTGALVQLFVKGLLDEVFIQFAGQTKTYSVFPGDALSCGGGTSFCSSITSVQTGSALQSASAKQSAKPPQPTYSQGEYDSECLTDCGNVIIKALQNFFIAEPFDGGDTEALKNVTVGFASYHAAEIRKEGIKVITSDPLGLQDIVDERGDAEASAATASALAHLPTDHLQAPLDNPVDVEVMSTDDGALDLIKLQNGDLLVFEYSTGMTSMGESPLESAVVSLRNHMAVITGNGAPVEGEISYPFTAFYEYYFDNGSYGLDGKTVGEGAYAGNAWVDSLGNVGTDFWTNHDNKNFNIQTSGQLQSPTFETSGDLYDSNFNLIGVAEFAGTLAGARDSDGILPWLGGAYVAWPMSPMYGNAFNGGVVFKQQSSSSMSYPQ